MSGFFGTERDGETIVALDNVDDCWDGDCEGVGDGDRDGSSTLACLVFGLRLGYLDGSLLCLPCVGLFQYVWSPKPLAFFMFF
jgi:hypothetical protein